MPAADIFVVLCHSLAKPKSVIFKVFLPMSSFSIFSSNKTGKKDNRPIRYSGIKGLGYTGEKDIRKEKVEIQAWDERPRCEEVEERLIQRVGDRGQGTGRLCS